MSREQLEQSLQRLRDELETLDKGAGSAHERVRDLINEVEFQMHTLHDPGSRSSLADEVRHQIEQFEVEHPRVTNILNDLMVTLSNRGI